MTAPGRPAARRPTPMMAGMDTPMPTGTINHGSIFDRNRRFIGPSGLVLSG